MKVGDQIPVVIAGQVVAQAEVKELSDGTATLIVPATRVVMGTRTELTVEAPSSAGTVELLTDSVVRPEAVEAPAEIVTPAEPQQTNTEQPAPPVEAVEAPVEAPAE